MTLKLQFNADESILEPSITLKVDGVNDNVTILDLSDNGTQWSVNYPVGDTYEGQLSWAISGTDRR